MNRRAWIGVLAGIHLLVAGFFTVALVRLPPSGCDSEVDLCEDLSWLEATFYALSAVVAAVVALVWCPLLWFAVRKGPEWLVPAMSAVQVLVALPVLAWHVETAFFVAKDFWWPSLPDMVGATASLTVGVALWLRR